MEDHSPRAGEEHEGHEDHGGREKGGDNGDHGGHHEMMARDFRRRFFISLAATIPVLVLSPMLQELAGLTETLAVPGQLYIIFAVSSFIYLYGGWPFLRGLFRELYGRNPGMMTLVALAITVAFVYSSLVVFVVEGRVFFWELATLVDIMLLGHWVEMRSVMGASRALEELARLMPGEAHLVTDGGTKDVPVEELKSGDRVRVKPGEKVPADGEVTDGETSVNEAMLTGESKPVSKGPGDEVIGGSVNAEGSIIVEVRKTGEESFLSQVMELVRSSQASKSRTQDLADRAAMYLTVIALASGAITFSAWFLPMDRDFAFSLERTVTVMVITCPHALGLAIPLVVAVSTALSARKGVLIRNRSSFERARNLQAVIFDKTGTLTLGEFGLTDTITLTDDVSGEDALRFAAAVEAASEHPLARAVAKEVENPPEVKDFQAIKGRGAVGRVEGRDVKVVSPGYLAENGIEVEDDRIEKLSGEGKTVVFVLLDDRPVAALAMADIIRDESKEAVRNLRDAGIQVMMVTGDNELVAKYVAGEIGLDEYFAEVLPEKKAEKVKEVQSRGLVTAMVGDGINDAPALAAADVGIAIGAGTDVAVETADVVLVRSDPRDAASVITLSRATYSKMLQNLAWATGYNAFAIPLAAGVLSGWGVMLSPAAGAVLMSLSTVIVAVNARFLKA